MTGILKAGARQQVRGRSCHSQGMFTSWLVPGKLVLIGVFGCYQMSLQMRAIPCNIVFIVVLPLGYGASIPPAWIRMLQFMHDVEDLGFKSSYNDRLDVLVPKIGFNKHCREYDENRFGEG